MLNWSDVTSINLEILRVFDLPVLLGNVDISTLHLFPRSVARHRKCKHQPFLFLSSTDRPQPSPNFVTLARAMSTVS
jgi:hypothetical protein